MLGFAPLSALTISGLGVVNRQLTAPDLSCASQVESAALTQVHSLQGSSLSSASAVDQPAISQDYNVTAPDVSCAVQVDSATITQVHSISLQAVSAAANVGVIRWTWEEQYDTAEAWTAQAAASADWAAQTPSSQSWASQ